MHRFPSWQAYTESVRPDPDRWREFRKRYRAELRRRTAPLKALRQRAAHQRVTLIYSARDTRLNQAAVIKEFIQEF